ncbi:Uncharacterised protein [Mycobacteroides abscessus subsp. abscessus]|nr:Uncharacterised protein [Mycobacteroides abscessus subsp. abscessus]
MSLNGYALPRHGVWRVLYLFLILTGAQRIDLRTVTSIVIFFRCFGLAIAHGLVSPNTASIDAIDAAYANRP